jgi:hypothetical protein
VYAATKAALIARLVASFPEMKSVLDYEPQSIQDTPMIYVMLESYARSTASQITAMVYRDQIRLVLPYIDNQTVERALAGYVNSIPAALDQDPYLASTITSGFIGVESGQAGYYLIGGTVYRILDTYAITRDKAAFRSGI